MGLQTKATSPDALPWRQRAVSVRSAPCREKCQRNPGIDGIRRSRCRLLLGSIKISKNVITAYAPRNKGGRGEGRFVPQILDACGGDSYTLPSCKRNPCSRRTPISRTPKPINRHCALTSCRQWRSRVYARPLRRHCLQRPGRLRRFKWRFHFCAIRRGIFYSLARSFFPSRLAPPGSSFFVRVR